MNIQIGHDLQNTNKMLYLSLSYRKLNPRQFLLKHPTTLLMLRFLHAVINIVDNGKRGKCFNNCDEGCRPHSTGPHATHILYTAGISNIKNMILSGKRQREITVNVS